MATPRKVTPDDLNPNGFEFDGERFTVKSKYKIGKFFRLLETNPVGALEVILDEESYAKFEELEMDMKEFESFFEKVANVASGSSAKN